MPIPNNYKGKKPNEVWGEWNAEQKKHFLHDHFYSLGKSIPEGVYQLEWDNLPTPISIEISKHIDMEQYKNGGSVGKIKNMSLGMPVTYRGELYEITQKDGITHLTLNKEGAWGSDYPTIPLSRIDQSELKDINNNKVSIPYTFFKNGGGVKNYKVGDNVSEGNKVKYKKGDTIRYQLEYSASPMLATSKAEKSANIHTGKIAKVSKKLGGYVYTLTSGLEVSEHEVKGKIPKAIMKTGGGVGEFVKPKLDNIFEGVKVKILRGNYTGKVGTIYDVTFTDSGAIENDEISIMVDIPTKPLIHLGLQDILIEKFSNGGGVGELKGKTNKEISDMYWQMAENIEEEINSDRGGETTGLNFERLEKLEKEMNKYRELAIKYDNKKYANGGGVGEKKYAVYELYFGQPYNFYNEEQDKFILSEPSKATLYTEEEAKNKREKLLKRRIEYYQSTGKNYKELHIGNLFKKGILKYAKGGGVEDEQFEKLKREGKIIRYLDVRGNGKKVFDIIVPNKKEKGMYKRYESLSKNELGVLQNEYLDESDVKNWLLKTSPKYAKGGGVGSSFEYTIGGL